jgi:hypothetical protein
MDYFMKWLEAYVIPNQEALTVVEVLVTHSATPEYHRSYILTRAITWSPI